jgi:hypothetical protein
VSLVLSLETGLVSPQFHVRYDDFFETVRRSSQNPTTLSHWQKLAGFKINRHISSVPKTILDKDNHPTLPDTEHSQTSQVMPSSQEHEGMTQDESGDMPVNEGDNVITTEHHDPTQESPPQQCTHTCIIMRPEHLIEVAYSSYYDVMYEDDYFLQDKISDPIAFLSSHSDPDTMYFHEAIRQPDSEDFVKAIIKVLNDHIDRKHWILMPHNEVPKGTKILDSVWSMKKKKRPCHLTSLQA